MEKDLSEAIKVHREWIYFFERAVEDGECTEQVKKARYDDLCLFGKWLYSLPDEIKHTPNYRRTKDRHYSFHVEATVISGLLERKEFALARTALEGEFKHASAELITAIEDWRAAL